MRRLMAHILGGALLAATVGILAGAGPAQAVYICDTAHPINNTTVNDSVFVPGGPNNRQFCYINNSTINGSISVQPNSNLDNHQSTINGPISADHPFGFGLTDTTVTGAVNVNGTTPGGGYFICGSTLQGPLTIQNSSVGGFWQIGQLNACPGNNIYGAVTFTANANRIVFQGNTVHNSVLARSNTGGGDVSFNTISGSLVLQGNTPCWTFSANNIGGGASTQPCTPP